MASLILFLYLTACEAFQSSQFTFFRRSVPSSLASWPSSPQQDVSPALESHIAHVKTKLDTLYPPAELQQRTAASRTDGYWRYIQQGDDPPQCSVYGEFDFSFFANLLDSVLRYTELSSWENQVFTDLGSGTGRLVFGAALLYPFRLCRGIEYLPSIHRLAETKHKDSGSSPQLEFVEGSFEHVQFGDSNVIFSFSTAMEANTMRMMANAIAQQCQTGTIVITTEYALPETNRIQLLESIDGDCWLTGGTSTAFVHRVL